MSDRETYTVTKLAGPKVAGIAAKAGEELQLTSTQAAAELLAGSIVKGGKDSDGARAAEPFKGSSKLADIQARARGMEAAPKSAAKSPAKEPAKPAAGSKPATDGAPASVTTPSADVAR